MTENIVEAYVGEYASGKSENAVNRAIKLAQAGRRVTIVDLDLVEPFYTLRPIKEKLTQMGIDVVAWETKETQGLGEAGSVIKPEMRWVLKRQGDIILDIGYGVEGVKIFNIIEGAENNPNLKIYAVVNISRPMTSDVEQIVQYIKSLGHIDGIINNTHLGDETDLEVVQQGALVVSDAAKKLSIPVVATSIDNKFAKEIGETDCRGNPVWLINRYMPNTFW